MARRRQWRYRFTGLMFALFAIPVVILGGKLLPGAGFAALTVLVFVVEYNVLRWRGNRRG